MNSADGGGILSCTPTSSMALGQVRIGAGATTAPQQKQPSSNAKPATTTGVNTDCTEEPASTDPGGGMNPDPSLSPPPFPEGTNPGRLGRLRPGQPRCSKSAGFANLGKLNAALPFAAQVRFRLNVQSQSDFAHNYFRSYTYAHTAAVPSTGNALGFGFMPIKSTLETTQVAPPGGTSDTANIYSDAPINQYGQPAQFRGAGYLRSYVQLKVGGVSVNGTPMNLGDKCRTDAIPLDLKVDLGDDSTGRSGLQDGGTYTGRVTVPEFKQCGTGEDLSPLLNAMSAGTSNYVKIEAAQWCDPTNMIEPFCDQQPEPTTYSIVPGGTIQARIAPFTFQGPAGGDHNGAGDDDTDKWVTPQIRCDSATFKFDFKKGHYISKYFAGRVTDAHFTGCVRTPGDVPQEMKASGLPWGANLKTSADTGDLTMSIAGIYWEAAGADGCDLHFNNISDSYDGDIAGTIQGIGLDVKNDRMSFAGVTSGLQVGFQTACQRAGAGYVPSAPWSVVGDMNYKPHQKITSP